VTRFRLPHPAVYALVWIALAEVALSTSFRARVSASFDPVRNAYARRGWDEYTRRTSIPHPPERRILLLANSQGRGPEYPSGRIYPSLLQLELNRERAGPPVRLVNWSFGPNRVPETVLLLARARALRPDVVVAVFPPTWFQDEDYAVAGAPTPLSMFPSDLADTAWLYRRELPPAFADYYLKPVGLIDALFARGWPAWPYRDLPLSAFEARAAWVETFMPDRDRAAWFLRGTSSPRRVRSQPPANISGRWPNASLMGWFTDAAEALHAKRVFVLQPHYYRIVGGREVLVPLREGLLRSGFEVWDMMESVPWPEFLEESVHLTESGHAAFAHELAERLRPVLQGLEAADGAASR
jgi:hypothetical protein